MKSISGILGASSLLLLLATAGSAMFPGKAPDWTILLAGAVVSAMLSVITLRQSKKQKG